MNRLTGARRFFDLRLGEARAAQAGAEREFDEALRKAEAARAEAVDADEHWRSAAAARTLDIGQLCRLAPYRHWAGERFAAQAATAADAESRRDRCLQRMRHCYEEIEVLKRLERRRDATQKADRRRAAQLALDDSAALVAAQQNEEPNNGD